METPFLRYLIQQSHFIKDLPNNASVVHTIAIFSLTLAPLLQGRGCVLDATVPLF